VTWVAGSDWACHCGGESPHRAHARSALVGGGGWCVGSRGRSIAGMATRWRGLGRSTSGSRMTRRVGPCSSGSGGDASRERCRASVPAYRRSEPSDSAVPAVRRSSGRGHRAIVAGHSQTRRLCRDRTALQGLHPVRYVARHFARFDGWEGQHVAPGPASGCSGVGCVRTGKTLIATALGTRGAPAGRACCSRPRRVLVVHDFCVTATKSPRTRVRRQNLGPGIPGQPRGEHPENLRVPL